MAEKAPGILSPEKLVAWKSNHNLLHLKVTPKSIILCPLSAVVKSFSRLGSKKIKGLDGINVCIDEQQGIYLISYGIGSPALIAICEEFRALGAKRFILLGFAGRINASMTEGEDYLIKHALIAEGTSGHYGGQTNDSVYLNNQNLNDKLISFISNYAVTVSTDAVFRETETKLIEWEQQGAQLIDMETSALFSFGNFYELEVASVLIGADELTSQWKGPSEMKRIVNRMKEVIKKIIKSKALE